MFVLRSSAALEVGLAPEPRWRRRFTAGRTLIAAALAMMPVLFAHASFAQVPASARAGEMERWLAATAHQPGTISPGTAITTENWRQYRQFMPMGMQELFEDRHFWKMPKQAQINVGPTVRYPLPSGYIQATRDYSAAVRVVHLANGHNEVTNYAGGEPFPNPEEPDKGYKLLVDLWFAYLPHLTAGTPANTLHSCVQDEFGSISCLLVSYVYRQTAYNTDPGAPR